MAAHEDGGRVGPDPEEGALAEAEVARVAREDVPARGLCHPEEHAREEHEIEGRQAHGVAQDERGRQGEDGDAQEDKPAPQHQPARRVNRPRGRKSSATTMAENTTRGVAAGDHRLTSPAIIISSEPAMSVPTTLPMPPTMTIAKTMPIHSKAISGVSVRSTATSMPASAAVTPVQPARMMPRRPWSMPNADGDGAILGEGAQRAPRVRPLQEQVGAQDHDDRDGEGDERRRREDQLAQGDRPGGVGIDVRAHAPEVGAPLVGDDLDDGDEEPEADEQRVELRDAPRLEAPLERAAQHEHEGRGDEDGEERVDAEAAGQLVGEVAAQDDQPEVRQVDDLERAPGQRHAHGHERVEAAHEDAGHRRLEIGSIASPRRRA